MVWQDGSEEKEVPSTQLYYSISLDDHEFFPGEWVTSDTTKGECTEKYGVVQNVNYLERTACVSIKTLENRNLYESKKFDMFR